jgi:actin-related protein 2
MLKIACFI